ncbi:MAG: DNA ligase D [Bacteroidota bacterium]|nr:DNA ligase D [Bacteroidota bacterium]
MLAKETAEAFDDKGWLFEIKWDGYRAIAEKKKSKILLYSRNGLDFAEKYPVVVAQVKKVKADAVLDGEIVVLNDEGKPDFQFLQHYSENQNRPIQYYVFDLLELNGKDTTSLPLIDRKELLKKIIPENNPAIKYSDHIFEKGKSFFRVSKEKDLEGIMAKKMDSKYYPGKRTTDWLKIKNHKTAEVIITGYTEPSGSRKYFGSLILAAKEGTKFIYMGNAGTGFNAGSLKELYDLFQPLVQKKSPFEEKIKNNSKITWLKPAVICEVKFSEVTADGKLRHPVFLRLRDDKTINEINMDNIKDNRKSTPVKIKEKSKKKSSNISLSKSKNVSSSNKSEKEETDKVYSFGKSQVTVTHFNKVYFPDEKVTKGDVTDYYISMADYVLPYLKGRPESLLRNPNGIKEKGFFQKDAADDAPSFVHRKQVHSDSTNKEVNYIVCDNIETLVYLNNLGCIEINPWHSTVEALDKPDYLMIDIDPSDKNTFSQVIEVALTVKTILEKAGASCFCKTSGSSGMHIYVPAEKKYSYEQVKNFAYLVCMLVNDQLKDLTTLERNLQKRSKKQIYMDYLQNSRGQTIASVYSLRPKPGATVSTPLLWDEVKPGLSPKQFTIYNTLERVKKMGDLFKGVLGKGIDLEKCLKNLQNLSAKVAAE